MKPYLDQAEIEDARAHTPHTDDRWDPPPQSLTHEGPPIAVDEALRWMPSGPVGQNFLRSPMRISCAMGPLGCGKTTGGFIKGFISSMMVPPSPVDGVRHAKGVVVAPTYRELDASTIETFQILFPNTLGTFKGGGGAPAQSVIDWKLDDGTMLHSEIIFAAIGDHNVKNFCDGFEVTWAFLNKLDALPPDMIKYMWPRTGRWPPPMHRPAGWREEVWRHRKLFGDMNAPDIDNWTYGDSEKELKGFVENVPPGWKLFKYPGGLEAAAENKQNLPPHYYEELKADNPKWYVSRFVDNKFGYSREGEVVYSNYDDDLHVSALPLKFDPLQRLIIGLDSNRSGAAVAMQRTRTQGLRVLGEFVPPKRIGAKTFGKLLSKWCDEKFPDAKVEFTGDKISEEYLIGWCDPAGANPNEAEDEATWIDLVREHSGIPIYPAKFFTWEPRFTAVDDLLKEIIEGEPQFLMDPRCRMLRRGFSSGYIFGKTMTHGYEVTTDGVVKNDYSHPHEALQYGALGSSDTQALLNRAGRKRKTRILETPDDYHPHSG